MLLDDGNLRDTPHPKILRAEEHLLSEIEMKAAAREIDLSIELQAPDRLREMIKTWVEGYRCPDHKADEAFYAGTRSAV